MSRTVKALLAATTVIAASIVAIPAVHGAERATSVPGCAKSTATAHAPVKVKQPAAT